MAERTLIRTLRRLLARTQQARRAGVSATELAPTAKTGWNRRQLLVGAGAAGLLPLGACASRGFKDNPQGARVAIVGAGLAGMTCCHHLAKHGIYAQVYEALPQVGGRCLSGRGLFAGGPGLVTELGGQFIDSVHDAVLTLADELELSLLDRQDDLTLATHYQIGGARYSEDQLCEHLRSVVDAVNAAWETIEDDGESTSYADEGGAGLWDRMSIQEFLEQWADADSVATALLRSAFISEYGLEIDDQSALNLIFMLGTDPDQMDLFAGSDERYKIDGGNDQLVTRLADRYADRITLDRALSAISEASDGSYTLSFSDGSTVAADHVILSLPFSVLRQLDLDVALSTVKRSSIDSLGYGTNAKLLLPFAARFWREAGDSGEFFTDQDALLSGWDGSQLSSGDLGVLTVYLGGQGGVALAEGEVEEHATAALGVLEGMYPGCSAQRDTDPIRKTWPTVPTALGSYACYRVGQYTSIGGAEAEPAGNLRFIGEHTSYDWQGYMNGAVTSGRREATRLAEELWTGASWSKPATARATRRFPRPGGVLLDDRGGWRR